MRGDLDEQAPGIAEGTGGSELKAAAPRVLRAGAAMSNITPSLGEPIVGNFATPPANYVHDELHAHYLMLDDGATRLAFAICDNVGVGRDVFDAARKLVHEAIGLPPENMLLAATHTHSGTSAGGSNSMKPDRELSEYEQFLARRISDGIRRAANNLEPAQIGWGSVDVPTQLFNRRWHLKPGTPLPNPFGGTDAVKMNPTPRRSEPGQTRGTDRSSSVVPVGPVSRRTPDRAARQLFAALRRRRTAATHLGRLLRGFRRWCQKALGADRLEPPFVAMMTNGTSGDVNNINFRRQR